MIAKSKPKIAQRQTRTQQAYIEGWELCSRMKQLTMQGRGGEIVDEVRREYKRAVHYEFSKLASEFASFLMYHYYSLKGEKRRGDKYCTLALHHSELSYKEDYVAGRFASISSRLNKTKVPDPLLIEELNALCEELRDYLELESAQIWVYVYMLLNKQAYLAGDFGRVISQSYEVIEYMESKGIERTAHFWKDMCPVLIQMGRYEEAAHVIDKAIEGINVGSLSWSVYLYYKVVLAMHQREYQKAYDIYSEAVKKRQINPHLVDLWNIVKGYLNFLMNAGLVDGQASFRVGKFVNQMEVFQSDKAGHNVNIIILKILLRLNSDRDRIIEQRERIQRYAEMYLAEGSRPRIFLHRLHHLVPANFLRNELVIRVSKYVPDLSMQPGYDPDLEIIPYEHLWELLLNQLK